ncbi:MAG: hypothetical protein AAF211_00630 [Myxococcota bacterium]
MAALLGLIMVLGAWATEPAELDDFAPGALWRADDVPTRRYYRRIRQYDDGTVRGRSRSRRRARFQLWSLDNGVVVRLDEQLRGRLVRRRRFDPFGQPLTTVERPRDGWPSVTVHLVPDREIGLSGWEDRGVPGGTVPLPVDLVDHQAGVETWVLGGRFEVWHDPRPADVTSDAFWRNLVAGCGCDLVDRVTAWVDGRPGVRFRLARGADLQELWAVPFDERGADGVWYAGYHVPAVDPSTTSLRVAPGRALVAMVRLDRLAELATTEGDP